jgi:hypothetical protein
VRLEYLGGSYVGSADDDSSPEGELRAAAEATLDALMKAIRAYRPDLDISLHLREIGPFDAFGNAGVMVAVRAVFAKELRSLIGFSPVGDDPARAASLAVLTATNRVVALKPPTGPARIERAY